MKKQLCLFLILFNLPTLLLAKVIYAPGMKYDTSYGVKMVGSYEYTFTNYKTINFWGGIGAASSITVPEYPALEAELAIELRHYFNRYSYMGWNAGLYLSAAIIGHPAKYKPGKTGLEYSIGLNPGLYISYKKTYNDRYLIEPFVGVTRAMFGNDFNDLFNFTVEIEPRTMFNLGLRIGLNRTN